MSGRLKDRLQQAISQSNPPATFVIENGTVPPFDARLVTEVAPDRIVFTTLESAPYEKLVGRRDIPLEAQAEGGKYESFMRALGEKYRLERSFGVRTFQVEDLQYIQPVVLVWKRNDLP